MRLDEYEQAQHQVLDGLEDLHVDLHGSVKLASMANYVDQVVGENSAEKLLDYEQVVRDQR